MTSIREEELNMVAGGNIFETDADSKFLHKQGYLDKDFTLGDLIYHWGDDSEQVDKAWAAAGITSVTKPVASNQYFKDGTEISESVAWLIVGP